LTCWTQPSQGRVNLDRCWSKSSLDIIFYDISCEGMDLVQRPEKYKQWQTRNQRAGLRQLPLKSSIVKAVEEEVKKHYHKDFMICQDG
jgi:hypothetical protein